MMIGNQNYHRVPGLNQSSDNCGGNDLAILSETPEIPSSTKRVNMDHQFLIRDYLNNDLINSPLANQMKK